MKQGTTLFLKITVIFIGLAALAVCISVLPGIAGRDAEAHPETAYLQYPFLISAYVLAIPFLAGLYQTLKLLNEIDRNRAFSEYAVKALWRIKNNAALISLIITAGVLYVMAGMEGDRTGVIMLGFIGLFASSVVAVFAALLQKVLQDAIAIQAENEFTV